MFNYMVYRHELISREVNGSTSLSIIFSGYKRSFNFHSTITVMPAIAAHILAFDFILVSQPANNLSSIINTSNSIFRK